MNFILNNESYIMFRCVTGNREMGKEKILFIAQEGLNKGGVQTVIMNIVHNLSDNYQFDIVLFTKEKRYYDEEFKSLGGKIYNVAFFESRNVNIRRVEKVLRRTIGFYIIKHIIRKNGPYKAIHCHNSIESDIALKAAKQCGIEIRVNHIHVVFDDTGLSSFQKSFYFKRKQRMSELATVSIGCSDKACQSFFQKDYRVVLNPYDDKLFVKKTPDRMAFESPVLIQVGNYSDLKNQLYTLAVFREVLREYPNARLNLVGHDVGGYMSKMVKYISDNDISHRVELFPSDTNIPKLIEQSCYCLLPSRTESFGIVLVEAQVMGLKCFVSDVVPPESNAGGCQYLSINETPMIWARAILNDFKDTHGGHSSYNVKPYKGTVIAKQIEKFYKS